jgi:hypothetical protein
VAENVEIDAGSWLIRTFTPWSDVLSHPPLFPGHAYQKIDQGTKKIGHGAVGQFQFSPFPHVLNGDLISELVRHIQEPILQDHGLKKSRALDQEPQLSQPGRDPVPGCLPEHGSERPVNPPDR